MRSDGNERKARLSKSEKGSEDVGEQRRNIVRIYTNFFGFTQAVW